MMKRIIPIMILLAVIGVGYWWYTRPLVAESEAQTGLVGSGSIEAEVVAITAELGGRIIQIKVDEGDEVAAGQVLIELDKAELLAQREQLEAAVLTARANLKLVSAEARPEEIAAAEARLSQAQVVRDGADLTWQRARMLANDPHALEARINQARAQITEAGRNLEMAQVNLKRMDIEAETASRNQSNHEALVRNEAAQKRLQAAQVGVEMADVALAGSKRQVEHLVRMREQPLQLIAQANSAEAAFHQTEARVLAAEANLDAVAADPRVEDIAVARAQLLEAEANLAAIKVQLSRQTLIAPRAGLISQKLANPGELASPGAILLELADIDTVDLIVYIPEDRIGEVKIGQQAQVYVDAYENEVFEGSVTFIAHEAEFTPRNVQTKEERVNLVFAVKITLDNADHRLKPGMPADAEILPGTQVQEAVEVSSPTPSPQPTATPTTMLTPTPTPFPTMTPAAAESEAASSESDETPATARAEVLAWGLKVRSGPGIDQPAFAHLSQGDIVSIMEVDPQTGWFLVQLPTGDQTGWITNHPNFVSVK